jgi:HK97 family phage prohead protease
MLLRKTLSLSDVSLKAEGDAARFSGYASVFGNVDADGDIILRGAFDYTLRNTGKPKMFFNHDWSSIPVGKWLSAKEDDHGLWVEGEFTPGLASADAVRAAMKHGTLDGLSVGGMVKTGDWEDAGNGQRLIRKWTRLVEISPVVFPANGAARVDLGTVKGGADLLEAIEEAATIREIEVVLRDAVGLSKGAAAALVARVKAVAPRADPADADAETIRQIAERVSRFATR